MKEDRKISVTQSLSESIICSSIISRFLDPYATTGLGSGQGQLEGSDTQTQGR